MAQQLLQLVLNGFVTGSIIAIAAVGLSLVYGILRIVNFAHGEYLTFGAFMGLIANAFWGGHMVLATLFAIAATAGLGIALEFGLWGPMRRKGAGLLSLFITSIGLALVIRHALFLGFGARPRRYGVDVFQAYQLGIVRLSLNQIVVIAVALVALPGVGLLLARTKLGKGMRAISDDRDLAMVAGIDADRVTAHTWILAAGLAGLAGVLQGLLQAAFNPNMGFSLLLPIFAAVILGGVGSAYGALVAGLGLGIAMEVSTWDGLAGGLPGVYKPVVAFALLILVLLVRPQGIFGKARVV